MAYSIISPGDKSEGQAPRQLPNMTGRLIVPAYDCIYSPSVEATDLLRVDFDVREVNSDGLYLVEELGPRGVVWRGCRRFARMPELHMDRTGRGAWHPLPHPSNVNLRIVGHVETVYKPTK